MRNLCAMAQETKKPQREGIAVEDIVALQARVAAGQLQAEDFLRLGKLLELLLTLVQMLVHPKLKLHQISIRQVSNSSHPSGYASLPACGLGKAK